MAFATLRHTLETTCALRRLLLLSTSDVWSTVRACSRVWRTRDSETLLGHWPSTVLGISEPVSTQPSTTVCATGAPALTSASFGFPSALSMHLTCTKRPTISLCPPTHLHRRSAWWCWCCQTLCQRRMRSPWPHRQLRHSLCWQAPPSSGQKQVSRSIRTGVSEPAGTLIVPASSASQVMASGWRGLIWDSGWKFTLSQGAWHMATGEGRWGLMNS